MLFPCARHFSEPFTCIWAFNAHKSPIMSATVMPGPPMRTLSTRSGSCDCSCFRGGSQGSPRGAGVKGRRERRQGHSPFLASPLLPAPPPLADCGPHNPGSHLSSGTISGAGPSRLKLHRHIINSHRQGQGSKLWPGSVMDHQAPVQEDEVRLTPQKNPRGTVSNDDIRPPNRPFRVKIHVVTTAQKHTYTHHT